MSNVSLLKNFKTFINDEVITDSDRKNIYDLIDKGKPDQLILDSMKIILEANRLLKLAEIFNHDLSQINTALDAYISIMNDYDDESQTAVLLDMINDEIAKIYKTRMDYIFNNKSHPLPTTEQKTQLVLFFNVMERYKNL